MNSYKKTHMLTHMLARFVVAGLTTTTVSLFILKPELFLEAPFLNLFVLFSFASALLLWFLTTIVGKDGKEYTRTAVENLGIGTSLAAMAIGITLNLPLGVWIGLFILFTGSLLKTALGLFDPENKGPENKTFYFFDILKITSTAFLLTWLGMMQFAHLDLLSYPMNPLNIIAVLCLAITALIFVVDSNPVKDTVIDPTQFKDKTNADSQAFKPSNQVKDTFIDVNQFGDKRNADSQVFESSNRGFCPIIKPQHTAKNIEQNFTGKNGLFNFGK